jgi:alpha-1,6-mannosyltransferase
VPDRSGKSARKPTVRAKQTSSRIRVALLASGGLATASHARLAFGQIADGTPLFGILVVIACTGYLVALAVLARCRPLPSSWPTWTILAFALVMRLPALFPTTGTGSDIYRYIWDARLQRHGHNPFVVIPSDPAYRALHTVDTLKMNNMSVPSPYPPAAQLFFRAVTAFSESPRAIKAALVAADLLASLALLQLLRTTGRPEWLVMTYAWHPLVVLESSRNGHLDALGALLLVSAALALAKRRSFVGTLAFVTAVTVKFLPAVLAPLLWRRIRVRDATAGGALVAALYWPYVQDGVIPIGSVSTVIDRFRFNGPVYEGLEGVVGPWAVAWIALAAGFWLAAWLRAKAAATAPEAWAWPMAVTLIFAPLVYPWYLVWLVPFLTTRWTLPLLVWSITILPVYVVWAFPPGTRWAVPRWLLAIEYGAAAATLAFILTRARRGHAPLSCGNRPAGSSRGPAGPDAGAA